jgi:hypothetical protein
MAAQSLTRITVKVRNADGTITKNVYPSVGKTLTAVKALLDAGDGRFRISRRTVEPKAAKPAKEAKPSKTRKPAIVANDNMRSALGATVRKTRKPNAKEEGAMRAPAGSQIDAG